MLEQVVNELLEGTVAQTFRDNFLKEIPAQQFEETGTQVTPSAFFLETTLLLEGTELLECLSDFSHARTRGSDRFDDEGTPTVRAGSHGKHSLDFLLEAVSAGKVGLVDDVEIGDFHNAGLEGLHVVTHARDQEQGCGICQASDFHFVLAYSNGFNQHHVAARRVEDRDHVVGGWRQASQLSACSHAADVNLFVARKALHADAVAKEGAARKRAGGVNRDDSHARTSTSTLARKLFHQGAFPGPGRPCNPDDFRLPGGRKQPLQELRAQRVASLYRRDSASDGPPVSREHLRSPSLD